jgi:hypothetical protein
MRFFLDGFQKFRLKIQRNFADLVQKSVPPDPISKSPIFGAVAPVKAPFS